MACQIKITNKMNHYRHKKMIKRHNGTRGHKYINHLCYSFKVPDFAIISMNLAFLIGHPRHIPCGILVYHYSNESIRLWKKSACHINFTSHMRNFTCPDIFFQKHASSMVCSCLVGDVGCFLKALFRFQSSLAWNKDKE